MKGRKRRAVKKKAQRPEEPGSKRSGGGFYRPVGTEVNGGGSYRPIGTEENGGGSGIEADREQLISGFRDDFTLREIATKLPWKSLCKLASESPAWFHAMRNREVYNARVISGALESLVILRFNDPSFLSFGFDMRPVDYQGYDNLGLYSTRDGLYFELPPLPVCERGIPTEWKCLTLDGRIYVLGEQDQFYALDLAGPKRQWKQCASMLLRKDFFRCVPFDGKIYAIGYEAGRRNVGNKFEVYDPNQDTWSLIEGRMPFRGGSWFNFTTVGEEVVVLSTCGMEDTADLYHPGKDEWRVVNIVALYDSTNVRFPFKSLFTVEGKLYRCYQDCIYVMDLDTQRWVLKHHYSFTALGVDAEERLFIRVYTGVGDELAAIIIDSGSQMWMVHSKGFGGENIEIVWHVTELSFSNLGSMGWGNGEPGEPSAMYPIQL